MPNLTAHNSINFMFQLAKRMPAFSLPPQLDLRLAGVPNTARRGWLESIQAVQLTEGMPGFYDPSLLESRSVDASYMGRRGLLEDFNQSLIAFREYLHTEELFSSLAVDSMLQARGEMTELGRQRPRRGSEISEVHRFTTALRQNPAQKRIARLDEVNSSRYSREIMALLAVAEQDRLRAAWLDLAGEQGKGIEVAALLMVEQQLVRLDKVYRDSQRVAGEIAWLNQQVQIGRIERYFVCKNQLQYLEKPLKF